MLRRSEKVKGTRTAIRCYLGRREVFRTLLKGHVQLIYAAGGVFLGVNVVMVERRGISISIQT